MKDKMIRVGSKLLEDLKLLKKISGYSTYDKVIGELVHDKLMETSAYTLSGYFPVGTVVMDSDGKIRVIKKIVDGRVIFNDSSSMFNGGKDCLGLKKLADDVSELNSKGEVKL